MKVSVEHDECEGQDVDCVAVGEYGRVVFVIPLGEELHLCADILKSLNGCCASMRTMRSIFCASPGRRNVARKFLRPNKVM